jgi:hypothetical protein
MPQQTPEARRGNAIAGRLDQVRKNKLARVFGSVLQELQIEGIIAEKEDSDAVYAALAVLVKNSEVRE